MSLWTPDGEHPVDPGRRDDTTPDPDEDIARDATDDASSFDDLSPEDQEQAREMAARMAEVQEQLASMPAADVVANHVMGLYELAAIHLSQEPPNFAEGTVAIDAMAAVVEGLPGRLGENEATLVQALSQLRMVFVQLREES